MKPDIRREIDGRLSITQARTPTGTTFQFINIYQFTASNPMGQTDMWTTTENWITKQKNNRIIMQGDLNCAHPGCRWDYAQPLNRDLGMADNKLEHFLNSTGGHSYAQQEHTWKGKGCQAALDHGITWNYHLSPQITKPNPKSHKKSDHNQIWPQCRWLHSGDIGSHDERLCPIGFQRDTSVEVGTRVANGVGIGATKKSKCSRCPLMTPLQVHHYRGELRGRDCTDEYKNHSTA